MKKYQSGACYRYYAYSILIVIIKDLLDKNEKEYYFMVEFYSQYENVQTGLIMSLLLLRLNWKLYKNCFAHDTM